MNGLNHAIVGASAGVAVGIAALSVGDIQTAALSIPVAMAGAKLPDADHKSTKQGKVFSAFRAIIPAIAIILCAVYVYCFLYKGVKLNPFVVVIPIVLAYILRDGTWFWKHRHGTHTLIFPVIFLILYFCIAKPYPVLASVVLALNAGYVSHLLADMLTTDGVLLLYPFYKKKIALTRIKSKEETKCRVMAIALGLVFVGISLVFSF